MSTVRVGFKCHMYFNTGSVYATPTWAAVDMVSDAAIAADFDGTEASTRASNGVKEMEPTMLGLGVTGQIRVNDTDAGFLLLDERTYMRTGIDMLVLNGPKDQAGTRGWRFWAKNHKLGEDQKLGAVLFREFDLKPCPPPDPAQPPKRAIVDATNALVYVAADAANPT